MTTTDKEFRAYATRMGADVEACPAVLPLVQEAFNAPVPTGWTVVRGDDADGPDDLLFFHETTGVCIAEHPLDKIYRQRIAAMQQFCNQTNAASQIAVRALGDTVTDDDGWGDLVSAAGFSDSRQCAPAARSQPGPVFDVPVPHSDSDADISSSDENGNNDVEPLDATFARGQLAGRQAVPAIFTVPSPIVASASSAADGAVSSRRAAAAAAPVATKPRVRVPAEFVCPITACLMDDPVVATDGFSYERAAIEQWLAGHDTSPCTNAVLPTRAVVPNFTLRSFIRDFAHRHDLVDDDD